MSTLIQSQHPLFVIKPQVKVLVVLLIFLSLCVSSAVQVQAQDASPPRQDESKDKVSPSSQDKAANTQTETNADNDPEKIPESSFYQDFLRQREETLYKSKKTADQSHVEVSKRLHRFSAYVDKFFVEESYVTESQESRLRVSLVNQYQRHESASLQPRMSLSLALPNTENKWRLNFQSDEELDGEQSTQINATGSNEGTSSFITSLGRILKTDEFVDIRFDAGIKFRTPVDPFTRLKARRSFQFEHIEVRLTETFQWRDTEGNTASTLIETEYPFSSNYFFRSRSELIYWDINSFWSMSQSFTLFNQLGPKSIIAYAIGIQGQDEDELHQRSKHQVNEYWIEARYRKNFYQDWLFYQITPGLTHPREYNFESLPRLELKLEAVFGRITE